MFLQALPRLLQRLRASKRLWRWALRILPIVVLVPLILQWVLAYLLGSDARLLPIELQGAKNLLIVTAHPDDECLFFSPSILGVLDRNHHINGGLIVMSTGKRALPETWRSGTKKTRVKQALTGVGSRA